MLFSAVVARLVRACVFVCVEKEIGQNHIRWIVTKYGMFHLAVNELRKVRERPFTELGHCLYMYPIYSLWSHRFWPTFQVMKFDYQIVQIMPDRITYSKQGILYQNGTRDDPHRQRIADRQRYIDHLGMWSGSLNCGHLNIG